MLFKNLFLQLESFYSLDFLRILIILEFISSILLILFLFITLLKKNHVNLYYLSLVNIICIICLLTFYFQDFYIYYNFINIYKNLILNDLVKNLTNTVILNYTNTCVELYSQLLNLISLTYVSNKTDFIFIYPINLKFYQSNLMFNLFIYYSKLFSILIFIICLIISYTQTKIIKISFEKLVFLLLPILISNFLLISSQDLIISYLAIELQNLCLIFLIALKKNNSFNIQLSIRFFILNSIGSLFLLLGIIFLYNIFLTTNIINIYIILSTLPLNILQSYTLEIIFSLTMLLLGLFFKLAVGPFGLWLVEIYEYGLTTSILIFSLIPKIGYFVFLFHLFLVTSHFLFFWDFILKIFGFVSIILGTFGALSQIYLKRLLAFSSLNYFGYILLSFIGFNQKSLLICILYFFIYVFISFYIWYIIMYLEHVLKRNIILIDLVILREQYPILAFILSLSFFFLAGLPPFYLFILKFSTFYIFIYSVTNLFLIFIFLICSFISIFYYLKLIKIMYFNPLNTKNVFIYPINSLIIYLIIFFVFFILSPFCFFVCDYLLIILKDIFKDYLFNMVVFEVVIRTFIRFQFLFEYKRKSTLKNLRLNLYRILSHILFHKDPNKNFYYRLPFYNFFKLHMYRVKFLKMGKILVKVRKFYNFKIKNTILHKWCFSLFIKFEVQSFYKFSKAIIKKILKRKK